MNSRLFRKTALDRLSSPEQLDHIMRISSAHRWFALLALTLLACFALGWAMEGTVPTTASGKGMIVTAGGLLSVVPLGSGIVTTVYVKVGEHIKANQVVARIAEPDMVDKIQSDSAAVTAAREELERGVGLKVRQRELKVAALQLQRQNAAREASEITAQAQLAEQQVPVADRLFSKGLVTQQQTIDARQKVVDLHAQVEQKKATIEQIAQEIDASHQEVEQAQLDMQSRLAELERQLALSRSQLHRTEIVTSPYPGKIVELKVLAGGSTSANVPILTIQPDADAIEVIAFVPSFQVKDAQAGMEAQISPSNIKREEYGYIRGEVTFVADYPATPAAILKSFQNESMTGALTSASEPVTEVHMRPTLDTTTTSGFQWSSSRGPNARISSGSICNVDIITRREHPITMLVPTLKAKFGLE